LKQLSSLLKISVSLLFFFHFLTASGGDPFRLSAGAGEAGMGYVCIMRDGLWSSFHNQANLAHNKSFLAGFNYENRFSLKELGTRTAGLIVPAGKSSLAATYSQFGYADFRRVMTGVATGLKLNEKISVGVQIDYFSVRSAGEYNNDQAVTFETGMVVTPSEKVSIGIHLFNPLPNSLRKNSMPTSLRIGAGTYLNSMLFAGAEAEMSSGSKLNIRTGFEYEIAKKIWLRAGFVTDNNSFSFGMGYLLKFAQLDLAFSTHDRLGITSSASLVFKIR